MPLLVFGPLFGSCLCHRGGAGGGGPAGKKNANKNSLSFTLEPPSSSMVSALILLAATAPAWALNNGLAQKPGLGWNSDYCTACKKMDGTPLGPLSGFQNEAFIKHIADFINASGLQALGYTNGAPRFLPLPCRVCCRCVLPSNPPFPLPFSELRLPLEPAHSRCKWRPAARPRAMAFRL